MACIKASTPRCCRKERSYPAVVETALDPTRRDVLELQ